MMTLSRWIILGAAALFTVMLPQTGEARVMPIGVNFGSALGTGAFNGKNGLPIVRVARRITNTGTQRNLYNHHHTIHVRRGFRHGYHYGYTGHRAISRDRLRRFRPHHRVHYVDGYRRGYEKGVKARKRHEKDQAKAGKGARHHTGSALQGRAATRQAIAVRRPPPDRHELHIRYVERSDHEPWSEAWLEHCRSKYRTFNPRTGTYFQRRGVQRFCR